MIDKAVLIQYKYKKKLVLDIYIIPNFVIIKQKK